MVLVDCLKHFFGHKLTARCSCAVASSLTPIKLEHRVTNLPVVECCHVAVVLHKVLFPAGIKLKLPWPLL